jgi:branched-subunit amino acid aminotransferase/4-amino-4-deoxychorismate lyase
MAFSPGTERARDRRLLFVHTGELAPVEEPIGPAPLIADSWLVADGAALAPELHERRFCDACAKLLPQLERGTLQSFVGHARAALPREGVWFARLEAYAGPAPRLALLLRSAPPRELQTRLWVAPEPDPRAHPRIKGPDLPVLAALRETARLAGADDALLSDEAGTALEAAHAALVWWRGDALCLPACERRVLPSVTRALLVAVARRRRLPVVREPIRPHELTAIEAWTLNSLHGIRPVCGWHRAGVLHDAPVSRSRVDEWSQALTEMLMPLDARPRATLPRYAARR